MTKVQLHCDEVGIPDRQRSGESGLTTKHRRQNLIIDRIQLGRKMWHRRRQDNTKKKEYAENGDEADYVNESQQEGKQRQHDKEEHRRCGEGGCGEKAQSEAEARQEKKQTKTTGMLRE